MHACINCCCMLLVDVACSTPAGNHWCHLTNALTPRLIPLVDAHFTHPTMTKKCAQATTDAGIPWWYRMVDAAFVWLKFLVQRTHVVVDGASHEMTSMFSDWCVHGRNHAHEPWLMLHVISQHRLHDTDIPYPMHGPLRPSNSMARILTY